MPDGPLISSDICTLINRHRHTKKYLRNMHKMWIINTTYNANLMKHQPSISLLVPWFHSVFSLVSNWRILQHASQVLSKSAPNVYYGQNASMAPRCMPARSSLLAPRCSLVALAGRPSEFAPRSFSLAGRPSQFAPHSFSLAPQCPSRNSIVYKHRPAQ